MTNIRLKNGFGQICNDIIRNPNISLRDKGVYSYLVCFANNETNELFVSVNKIASECGVTPSTIKRCLKALVKNNIIARVSIGYHKSYKTIILK